MRYSVSRLEEHPVAAETLSDLGEVGVVVAGVAVAQLAAVIAGIGVVKAGFTFQNGLPAWRAVPGHRDGEQRAAHRAAFAQGAAAAARPFKIAGREIDALRDRTIHLVRIEALDLGR